MTGKTHAAVGLGTVLAVTQPSTVSGLVLAAGTGMLGALISDIDVGTSKSHKDADRITLIAVLLVAAEIALNCFYDFSIWEKITAVQFHQVHFQFQGSLHHILKHWLHCSEF